MEKSGFYKEQEFSLYPKDTYRIEFSGYLSNSIMHYYLGKDIVLCSDATSETMNSIVCTAEEYQEGVLDKEFVHYYEESQDSDPHVVWEPKLKRWSSTKYDYRGHKDLSCFTLEMGVGNYNIRHHTEDDMLSELKINYECVNEKTNFSRSGSIVIIPTNVVERYCGEVYCD